MNKKCIRNLILVVAAFLLVLGVLSFVFFKINLNFKNIEEIKIDYQKAEDRKEEITFLNNSLSQLQSEVTSFNSHFLRNSDIVTFFNEIEKIGDSVSASARVVSVGSLNSIENEDMSISVNVTGSFESIYKFLLLLENSKYEIKIKSFRISKDSSDSVDLISGTNINKAKWKGNLIIKVVSFIKE